MYTEDEAETKWCPFARITIPLTQQASGMKWAAPDGGVHYDRSAVCIGSSCMSWRWKPLMADAAFGEAIKKAAAEIGDKAPSRAKATQHVMENRAKYGLPDKPFQGYCGLAGKPEA